MLIFDIDSPGGYLKTSEDLANTIAYLDPKKVRTVAYIPKQALSGAAIIALGCNDIYMHPDAHIGDAAPIEVGKGQWFERAPEKILSDLVVTLRQLADRKSVLPRSWPRWPIANSRFLKSSIETTAGSGT